MFDSIKNMFSSVGGAIWPYFETIWNAFGDYVYLQVAFVATVGFLLARLLAKYIPDLLSGLLKNRQLSLGEDIINLLRFPLFNLTFIAALLIATNISGMNDAVMFGVTSVLKSSMIAVFGIFIYRLIRILLSHSAEKNHGKGIIQLKTLPLFNNAALVFVLIGTAHQIFAVWDVDMTALLASAGIAGIAVGMAAQGTIADIIAGILILTDEPFAVGDVVELGSGDSKVKGVVTRVGIRSTRILNEFNVEIVMPNALLGNSRVLNETSSKDKVGAIFLEVSVASGVDADRIRTILMDVANNYPDALHDREKDVHMVHFDWRQVKFEVVCWAAKSDWEGHAAAGLREAVYKRLCQENIPLALPEIGEMAVTKMADSRREIAITEMADSRQEISITDMPESTSNVRIKEAPNLFGLGPVKQNAERPLNSRRPEKRTSEETF